MVINDNFKKAPLALSLSASGVIGTAAATVDQFSAFNLTATAAGLSFTLPSPTDTTFSDVVEVGNVGSNVFECQTVRVAPGDHAVFRWQGAAWQAPTARGAVVNLVGQIVAFATNAIPTGYKLLDGQMITNGATLYPILAAMYPAWVSGANLVLPDLRGSTADGGYFLRGANASRAANTFQADAFKSHNHQGGDTVANPGDRVLAQVSNGGSNTSTTADATTGELNILNSYTMIPMEGGTETRPINYTVWWAVATDGVLTPMANTINLSVSNYSPISDWTANTAYAAGDIVYVSPYLYRRITSGTSGATFNTTEQAQWTQISPQSNATYGAPNPNITPPAGTPVKGDHYIQTSDGTASGVLQASYLYSGTAWVMLSQQPTSISTPSGSPRSYYPAYTSLIERYAAVPTAANITASTLTGVGGATATAFATVWNGMGLISCNATRATTATAFTVPTSYVRQELAITPGFANTYFIKTLGDRECCLEVWVCDPATGVPVKRLAAKGVASIIAGIKTTIQLSPKEEYGSENSYTEWLGFEIPVELITAYKTATNTIKLAIRPANLNGETNIWYYAGYAMVRNEIGFTVNNVFTYDNQLNGGAQLVYGGQQDGIGYWSIAANTTINQVRVALPRTDKDVYVSLVALGNVGGNRTQWVEATIAHASGNVLLGRPKPHIRSPLAEAASSNADLGLPVAGWLIPAATLTAKSVTPANSGIGYLELNLVNRNTGAVAYGTSFVVEAVN